MSAPAEGGDINDPVELEHAIGYAGRFQGTVYPHPNDPSVVIHDIGSVVVIADINDPYASTVRDVFSIHFHRHKQEFLRGHDEAISALEISRSGSLVCSGQLGSTHSKVRLPAVAVVVQLCVVPGQRSASNCLGFCSASTCLPGETMPY